MQLALAGSPWWCAARLLQRELGTSAGEGRLLKWCMQTAAELIFRFFARLDAKASTDARASGSHLPQLDIAAHADVLAYLRANESLLSLLPGMSPLMLEQLEPLVGQAFKAIMARVRRREEQIRSLKDFTAKAMANLQNYNTAEDSHTLAQCQLRPVHEWHPVVCTRP